MPELLDDVPVVLDEVVAPPGPLLDVLLVTVVPPVPVDVVDVLLVTVTPPGRVDVLDVPPAPPVPS